MRTGRVGIGLGAIVVTLFASLSACQGAEATGACTQPWDARIEPTGENRWDWELCGPSKSWGLIVEGEGGPFWVTHPPREFASSVLGDGLGVCLSEFDQGAAMCSTTLVERGCAELRVFASGNVQYDIPVVPKCSAELSGVLACAGPAPYEPKRLSLFLFR